MPSRNDPNAGAPSAGAADGDGASPRAAPSAIPRGPTVGDEVHRRLRHGLLVGTWRPGERLTEAELTARFGVSRTPVREAIRRLAQEGLLEMRPGLGVRVRRLGPGAALDAYDVREQLEGMAARLAATRAGASAADELDALLARVDASAAADEAEQVEADLAFHRRIAELSGNEPLLLALETLAGHVTPLKVLTRDRNSAAQTRRQHRAIADAIARGDGDAAEARMREHVLAFKELLARRYAPDASGSPDATGAGEP